MNPEPLRNGGLNAVMNVRSLDGSPANFKPKDYMIAPILGSGRRYSLTNAPAVNASVDHIQ